MRRGPGSPSPGKSPPVVREWGHFWVLLAGTWVSMGTCRGLARWPVCFVHGCVCPAPAFLHLDTASLSSRVGVTPQPPWEHVHEERLRSVCACVCVSSISRGHYLSVCVFKLRSRTPGEREVRVVSRIAHKAVCIGVETDTGYLTVPFLCCVHGPLSPRVAACVRAIVNVSVYV